MTRSNIRVIDGLYFGWCELSIPTLWERLPIFFSGLGLLVTCIDSTDKVSGSPEIQDRMAKGWKLSSVGDAVYVPNSEIEKFMLDTRMLCGFDECYLVERPVDSHGCSGHFTTDGSNFAKSVPRSFVESFKARTARRYVSDGLGLNFVADTLELAEATMKVAEI